jgi:hypothetical protein
MLGTIVLVVYPSDWDTPCTCSWVPEKFVLFKCWAMAHGVANLMKFEVAGNVKIILEID